MKNIIFDISSAECGINEKTKVLLIGNINSIYIQSYAKKLHEKGGFIFDVLSLAESTISKPSYIHNVFTPKQKRTSGRFIKKLSKLFATYKLSKEIIKHNNYDIVHIHYLSWLNVLLMPILRSKTPKIVSMWGSDLYVDPKYFVRRVFQKIILHRANVIQLATQKMKEKFEKTFGKGYEIRFARFGTPIEFEKIDSLAISDINNFKSKYGIPNDKICVVCGYSAGFRQNHEYIIDELARLPKSVLSEISVVIPLTYGSLPYQKKIIEYAENLLRDKCSLVFLTDYLSDKEMACLRKSTDVMINVPKTDALSASMQETLYSGAVVINGSWLPYDSLYEKGIFDLKLDKIQNEKLSRKIFFAVKNIAELKQKSLSNKKVIKRISSWDYNIGNWIEIYNHILKNHRKKL